MTDVTIATVLVTVVTVPGSGGAHSWVIRNGRACQRRQRELNMTASFTRKLRQATMVLGFAAAVSALSSSASFAFSAEAQQMCTGDAFRLCSSDIPNIPAITACMIKHRAELSSGCRTVMDRDKSAKSGKVAIAQ